MRWYLFVCLLFSEEQTRGTIEDEQRREDDERRVLTATAVAGRKIMVSTAMDFMAELSLRVISAMDFMAVLCSRVCAAITRMVALSRMVASAISLELLASSVFTLVSLMFI